MPDVGTGEGLFQAGVAVTNLFTQLLQQSNQRKREIAVQTAVNAFQAAAAQAQSEIAATDPLNFGARMQEALDKAREEALAGLSEDPQALAGAKILIDRSYIKHLTKAQTAEIKESKAQAADALEQRLETLTKAYTQAASDKERDSILTMVAQAVGTAAKLGVIDDPQARMREFAVTASTAAVDEALAKNADNPEALKELARKLADPKAYPDLPPPIQAKLQRRALAAYYSAVDRQYNELTREDAAAARAQKRLQADTFERLSGELANGTLTDAEIDLAVGQGHLSIAHANYLRRRKEAIKIEDQPRLVLQNMADMMRALNAGDTEGAWEALQAGISNDLYSPDRVAGYAKLIANSSPLHTRLATDVRTRLWQWLGLPDPQKMEIGIPSDASVQIRTQLMTYILDYDRLVAEGVDPREAAVQVIQSIPQIPSVAFRDIPQNGVFEGHTYINPIDDREYNVNVDLPRIFGSLDKLIGMTDAELEILAGDFVDRHEAAGDLDLYSGGLPKPAFKRAIVELAKDYISAALKASQDRARVIEDFRSIK